MGDARLAYGQTMSPRSSVKPLMPKAKMNANRELISIKLAVGDI